MKEFCKRNHKISLVGRTKARGCKACIALWHRQHPDLTRKWTRLHPKIQNFYSRQNKLKRIYRVPLFGQTGIKEFYASCPRNMEVDHIVPLNGRFVSGLHVYWNLQYLTPEQNRKKSNFYSGGTSVVDQSEMTTSYQQIGD